MLRLDLRLGWNALILTLGTATAAAAQSQPARILRYIGRTLKPEPTMSLDTLRYRGPGSATLEAADDTAMRLAPVIAPRSADS